MKSLWITHRPHAPWYNDDLRLAKRIERRVERMFRKTGLEVHKEIFAEACNKYQRQLEFHKSSCYKSKIERAGKTSFFECRQTVSTWQLSPSFLYIFGRTDRRFQRLLYEEDPIH